MTKSEALSIIEQAQRSLVEAKARITGLTEVQVPSGSKIAIAVGDSLVILLSGGDVAVTPKRSMNQSTLELSESIKRYSAMAGPAGNVCPTCNGSGRI